MAHDETARLLAAAGQAHELTRSRAQPRQQLWSDRIIDNGQAVVAQLRPLGRARADVPGLELEALKGRHALGANVPRHEAQTRSGRHPRIPPRLGLQRPA